MKRVTGLFSLVVRVGRGFLRNDGFLLANAIAYDGLLSIVPLMLVATALFARFVDRASFLQVVRRELLEVVPQHAAKPVLDTLASLLEAPQTGGVLGLLTLLFFSTSALRTLQRAIAVIFRHRHETHGKRSLLASGAIAVGYVLAFGVISALQALAVVRIDSVPWLAEHIPSWTGLISTIGLALLISSFYLVMPVGRGSVRAALIGGTAAALAWRVVQAALVLYLRYVSRVNVIYGSLSALIVVLLSFEIAAVIALLSAQLVAELELTAEPANGRA